jgi:Rrf2 family protein
MTTRSMKISTRGRYGVRAILDLALFDAGGPVYLKDIARRQHLSHRYLERIFAELRRAGLLVSVRGSQGGFRLSRPAEAIRMSEVVEVLEGPILSVDCVTDPAACPITDSCVPHDLWARVNRAVHSVLESTTLADLVRQERDVQTGFVRRPDSLKGATDHV